MILSIHSRNQFVAFGAGLLLTGGTAFGLAPILDTDSYIFTGTNNPFAEDVSIGEDLTPIPNPATQPHFNFGVLEFSVDLMPEAPGYGLELTAKQFPAPGFPPAGPPMPTGSATVHLVALGSSFESTYLPPATTTAGDRVAWFVDHVKSQPIIATLSFRGQETQTVDVTSAIKAWRAGTDNFGFALWSSAGAVDLWSSDASNELGPNLVAVPEPSVTLSTMIGVLTAAGVLLRRRA